jgi:hypothetical protein
MWVAIGQMTREAAAAHHASPSWAVVGHVYVSQLNKDHFDAFLE